MKIIKDINELMNHSILNEFYKQEMNLRMNLAAASDLIRLEIFEFLILSSITWKQKILGKRNLENLKSDLF